LSNQGEFLRNLKDNEMSGTISRIDFSVEYPSYVIVDYQGMDTDNYYFDVQFEFKFLTGVNSSRIPSPSPSDK
jgi:hypothetical protein